MNPSDFYAQILSSITDDDLRVVANVMRFHVGQENTITRNALSLAAFHKFTESTDRKTREILERLVKEYHMPICASSGKAGYWLAANEQEKQLAIMDLAARRKQIDERINALYLAQTPPVEVDWDAAHVTQNSLFDMPKNIDY